LKPISQKPKLATLPSISGPIEDDENNVLENNDNEYWNDLVIKDYLSEELITMSRLPKSKWKTLINLDLIRERNKPDKPPEAPKAAPFVLPLLSGLEPRFVSLEQEEDNKPKSKIINSMERVIQSKFLKTMSDCEKSGNYADIISQLTTLSPSSIDFEIRSLSYLNDFEEFKLFLRFVKAQLIEKKNFDIIQAVLNTFLKLHMDIISTDENLVQMCSEIEVIQNQIWSELQDVVDHTLCLISFFTNTFDQL